ncbi:MAG: hypothetical protein OXI59_12165, partial [Gemmatimonadota bacterium]|nr:hypothetical protein [Gemmatimonadota bacterium]
VCIPLPNELRSNISKLALVALNNGDALTVHSARVWRIEPYGLSVCGNLSDLPATVAIGSQGTPAKIMSPTPEAYEGNLPNSGASAPPSNNAAMLLILGVLITILMSSTVFILSRAPRT